MLFVLGIKEKGSVSGLWWVLREPQHDNGFSGTFCHILKLQYLQSPYRQSHLQKTTSREKGHQECRAPAFLTAQAFMNAVSSSSHNQPARVMLLCSQ